MLETLRRFVCGSLIVSLAGLGVPLPASATLLSTQAALGADRIYLNAVLDRPEVRAQLEANGVSASDARARVAALTDAEAARLARHIDSLPAGGDALGALITAALIVFLVLLITDLLGFTKVFPFTRAQR